jgi:O-antigen ligase
MSTLPVSQASLRDATPLQAARWSAAVDPIGERLHVGAAMLYVFLLPLSTAPRDVAWFILLGVTVLRLPRIASAYRSWLSQPIFWAIVAYLAWMCLGLFWTSDVGSGLIDLKKHRMLLTPLMLLPVLGQASVLILTYLAGVVVVNLLQIMEWQQWPSAEWIPLVSRQGALNNQIVTGLFIAVAICFWLRMLIFARGWKLCFACLGLCLAGFGLVLSGSKGPIVAAMIGCLLALAIPFVTRADLRGRILVIAAALGVGLGLATWSTSSQYRHDYLGVTAAYSEFMNADEQPNTSGGLRRQALAYGIGVFKEHPILGTGTGAASRYMPEGMDLHGGTGDRVTLHNTYLLALVTLGLPGLLLLLWLLGAALMQAAPLASGAALAGGGFYALVTWMVAAGGDSYQGSGN